MKTKLGDIVKVEFWDHCEGGEDVVYCVVYGRLAEVAKNKICVVSWDCKDNETRFNLFSPAVTKVTKLKECK